jgi:biotin-dependent carboxylase-like uncharacterized protein
MIEVLSGGLYTSIQDLGRFGFRRNGIPLSGVMDRYSARLSNRLVGNLEQDAVMEITQMGPVLHFKSSTEIAITGAGFTPTLNNFKIALNTRTFVPENSILKFGLPGHGLRAYLSVSGGFISEKKLGSYSQYFGITQKQTIEKGDILDLSPFEGVPLKITSSVKVPKAHFSSDSIEVFEGPDYHLLSKSIQNEMLETKVIVTSQSNRMAYLLAGWEDFSAKEIITAPVQPGTVQLTPSGQCVVLMRDAQTTGGYLRVFQLTKNAINILSQKVAGSSLEFRLAEQPT